MAEVTMTLFARPKRWVSPLIVAIGFLALVKLISPDTMRRLIRRVVKSDAWIISEQL